MAIPELILQPPIDPLGPGARDISMLFKEDETKRLWLIAKRGRRGMTDKDDNTAPDANKVDTTKLSLMFTDLRLWTISRLWQSFAKRADKEGWLSPRSSRHRLNEPSSSQRTFRTMLLLATRRSPSRPR